MDNDEARRYVQAAEHSARTTKAELWRADAERRIRTLEVGFLRMASTVERLAALMGGEKR